jgi:AraC-like DNA-binding protein
VTWAGRPGAATYPDGAELAWRVLADHELVWVLQGSAQVAVRRSGVPAVTQLPPGVLLLLPPGVEHAFRWFGPRGCRHGFVHFAVDGEPVRPEPLAVAASPDDPLLALCRYLLWLGSRQPSGWDARVRGTLATLVDLLVAGPLPVHVGIEPAWPAPVLLMLERLRERWGAGPPLPPVRVADLAGDVHVSPAYLNRLARAVFGRPVSTLLEHLRLTRAELLLRGTSSPLQAIARACGFADAFHCSRRFSAAYGLPPGRYRLVGEPSLLDDPALRRACDLVWPW